MEATKEKLVKPSSYKRPRLPSGTPPKPAPRPAKKDLKKEPQEEKGEEEKPGVKKEEKPEERKEEKPEVTREEKPEEKKEEKPEERKEGKQEDNKAVKPEKKEEEPDGKKEEQTLTEQKKEEAVEVKEKIAENVSVDEVKKKEEETKKEETEAKETKPRAELKEPNENGKKKLEDVSADSGVSKENVDGKVENGETHNIEKKGDNQTAAAKDDLWVKRDSGKEALRPGGRSLSLKIQRSTSGTDKGPAASVRSATLPKPWSPGQAPSSMLSRKLSWEMPKSGSEDAVRGAKKDRSGSTSEVPIPEDSEEQSP